MFEMYVQSCTVLLQNLARIFSLFTENMYLDNYTKRSLIEFFFLLTSSSILSVES